MNRKETNHVTKVGQIEINLSSISIPMCSEGKEKKRRRKELFYSLLLIGISFHV